MLRWRCHGVALAAGDAGAARQLRPAAGRSVYLQIVKTDFPIPAGKGDSAIARDLEISRSRGKVVDRNGEVLAISTPMKSIWAIPPTPASTASRRRNWRRFSTSTPRAVAPAGQRQGLRLSATSRSRQVAGARAGALKLPGIHQNQEYRRYYPTGEMTAHMVGFTPVSTTRAGRSNRLREEPGRSPAAAA